MKDLSTLSKQELVNFFTSFDLILSDVDGVVWNFVENIPGAEDAVRSLQKLGKKIIFVSNNTTKTLDVFSKQFKDAGFDIDPNNIITPAFAMISFLKKRNFKNKKIFALGMPALKKELVSAGFDLVANEPHRFVKSVPEFVKTTMVDDETVGAVIADTDLNLNYSNLQKSITLLKNPGVIFLKGATDVRLPVGFDQILTGPGHFHNIMEEMAGRRGIPMGKPSQFLNDCIIEKYKITDPSKVLFMGDSIPQDMGFAASCGYRKFLVLSGLTKKNDLENWKYEEEFKPDFYVDSLKVVHDLIGRVYGGSL